MLIPGISDKEPICTKTPACYFVPPRKHSCLQVPPMTLTTGKTHQLTAGQDLFSDVDVSKGWGCFIGKQRQ